MSTPILPLAVWLSGTNENSIPANDNALRMEVALGAAIDFAGSEPVSPSDGDQYIVSSSWSGFAVDNCVIYKGGTWLEFEAYDGWIKTIDGDVYQFDGSDWNVVSGGGGGSVTQCIAIACSDETTALTTGTAKATFRMPYSFTLTAVRASLTAAQASGSIFTVDINEGGSTILSTKITIDNTEKTSVTAATAPVISDANLSDDAEITVDIDQIGDGTAAGLKIYLIGHQ